LISKSIFVNQISLSPISIEIGLFGSYTKGSQKETSDVDILVEFEKAIDLFTFVQLKNHLSDLLNINVDLVIKIL